MKTHSGTQDNDITVECSTPFGICDENTTRVTVCIPKSIGAQRLSASVMKTPGIALAIDRRD